MTSGDREGQIFLSHPHTKNGFFFLLTTKYHILDWKTCLLHQVANMSDKFQESTSVNPEGAV